MDHQRAAVQSEADSQITPDPSPISQASTAVFEASPTAVERKPDAGVPSYPAPPSSPATSTPSKQTPSPRGKVSTVLQDHRRRKSEPVWRPSVISIRPLFGLLALGLSIACM
ncbi:hypothetical protein LTR53_019905, partial [Teratosphaeriaceae sp. CCFEE 6253]